MRHSLFMSNIGPMNVRNNQAKQRLNEVKFRVSFDLSSSYREVSIETLLNNGLEVNENGEITQEAFNRFFQALAYATHTYVAVMISIGGKTFRTCYGPEEALSSTSTRKIPLTARHLPRLRLEGRFQRNADATYNMWKPLPVAKAKPAEQQPSVPAQQAPESRAEFLRPGQLAEEYRRQEEARKAAKSPHVAGELAALAEQAVTQGSAPERNTDGERTDAAEPSEAPASISTENSSSSEPSFLGLFLAGITEQFGQAWYNVVTSRSTGYKYAWLGHGAPLVSAESHPVGYALLTPAQRENL